MFSYIIKKKINLINDISSLRKIYHFLKVNKKLMIIITV